MEYKKTYVAVVLLVDDVGNTTPLSIIINGKKFNVDKVLSRSVAPAKHVGALLATRYELRILGKTVCLYREYGGRWFVEQFRQ